MYTALSFEQILPEVAQLVSDRAGTSIQAYLIPKFTKFLTSSCIPSFLISDSKVE